MLRPVCHDCATEMVCVKVGYAVAHNKGFNTYFGDKYRCNKCGHEVVVSFGEGMPKHQTTPNLLID